MRVTLTTLTEEAQVVHVAFLECVAGVGAHLHLSADKQRTLVPPTVPIPANASPPVMVGTPSVGSPKARCWTRTAAGKQL